MVGLNKQELSELASKITFERKHVDDSTQVIISARYKDNYMQYTYFEQPASTEEEIAEHDEQVRKFLTNRMLVFIKSKA